jgi:hypothetical protein
VGPVSMSSPEASRRTHRAFHRAFIGLLHKDKRIVPYGTVTFHNGKCGDRTTGSAVIEPMACAARPRQSRNFMHLMKENWAPNSASFFLDVLQDFGGKAVRVRGTRATSNLVNLPPEFSHKVRI